MIPENIFRGDLQLKDEDFAFIAACVKQSLGIVLGVHKKNMVYRRLANRIHDLGFKNFTEYCNLLKTNESEISNLANAITTNLTSFFREAHHFEDLKQQLIEIKKKTDTVRIWSAGCSNGSEPYSIALVIADLFAKNSIGDIKILATDIDSEMLEYAKTGKYQPDILEKIPKQYHQFLVNHGDSIEMPRNIKELIRFNRLNLLDEWPLKRKFDIIFCRNVVIYFDKDTQKIIFDRYADQLQKGGILYIGHSENLNNVSNRFQLCGRTIYQKIQ